MPEVLSLIDKKVTTIFTPYDFEELAAYEENTDEDTVEALKERVSELENELEILYGH